MNKSDLSIARRKMNLAADHAAIAFHADDSDERKRHEVQMIEAIEIAARVIGFRLVKADSDNQAGAA